MTISDKNGIYDLPEELSTNLRIFKEKLKTISFQTFP